MATIKRRKVTIVITETWTIAWSPEDAPLHPETSMLQDTSKFQEEPDATLLSTLMATGADAVSADPATPLTSAATSALRSDDMPTRPPSRRRSQRTRTRQDKENRSKP
jgi:hypothetical protein